MMARPRHRQTSPTSYLTSPNGQLSRASSAMAGNKAASSSFPLVVALRMSVLKTATPVEPAVEGHGRHVVMIYSADRRSHVPNDGHHGGRPRRG
jgi:hypothetical protein